MSDEIINNLDPEEREILESYERGKWHSVPNWQERLPEYQAAARAALERDGFVSLALPTEDLKEIQQRADQAGVPSDIFIADLVHCFIAGQLVER